MYVYVCVTFLVRVSIQNTHTHTYTYTYTNPNAHTQTLDLRFDVVLIQQFFVQCPALFKNCMFYNDMAAYICEKTSEGEGENVKYLSNYLTF